MFNKRLRATRMKKKFTQQKTADSLGIALRTYQCYEEGSRRPSYELLVQIADLFTVPVDFLLERDDFLRSLGVSVDEFQ
jgi:transcriptional regulator with XRE-family HTH domain